MRYDGTSRRRRVTEQLGEAVYAALGLMVREYLGADAAEAVGAVETEDVGAEVNGSFDTARYLALRGEAEELSAMQPVRETEVSRAGEAAEMFDDAAALLADTRERASALEAEGVSRTSAKPTAWRKARVEKRAAREAVAETETVARAASEMGDAFHTALRVSEEIERDARRYDGGVYLQ